MGNQPRRRLSPDPGRTILHQLSHPFDQKPSGTPDGFSFIRIEWTTKGESNMPVHFGQRLLSVLIMFTVFGAAQEPVKPKLTPSIITATRQVTLFTGLEKETLVAMQKQNKTS